MLTSEHRLLMHVSGSVLIVMFIVEARLDIDCHRRTKKKQVFKLVPLLGKGGKPSSRKPVAPSISKNKNKVVNLTRNYFKLYKCEHYRRELSEPLVL